MNKQRADRFYTIYALLVTILVLGFAWMVFESRAIYGADNLFSTKKQQMIEGPNESLSESAQEIIDSIRQKAKSIPKFENVDIEEV